MLSGHCPGHDIGQKQGQWQFLQGEGERRGGWDKERGKEKEVKNAERIKATALKETEADLIATWH